MLEHDESQRPRPTLPAVIKVRVAVMAMASLVSACLAGAAQAAEPTLVRNLAATCTSCHGFNGASIGGMPSLAGQPQPALLAALRAFRDGTRPATVMHHLARGYTDQQLEALAAFFAAQLR